MYSIKDFQQLINQAIAQSIYPANPKELYEPIGYFMDLSAKRVRPVLVLMACNLFSKDPEVAINPALGIEFFHNFTLIHDDIMDGAPMRRGKATVHEKWSNTVAILSGDLMLIEAYKLIAQVKPQILPEVLDVFNKIAVSVCEGQQMDMNFEQLDHVVVAEYIQMVRLKTARLIGCALQIGAILGGASSEDKMLLYTFGENMGIAFQLQDDILDLYGDPEKFGKQVGSDILSHKKTGLFVQAQALAQGNAKKYLHDCFAMSKLNPREKIQAIKAIYDQLEVRAFVEKIRDDYMQLALGSLERLSVDMDKKNILQKFAEQLLRREN